MSWTEFTLARQLLMEEHIGTRVREAKHIEDKIAAKTRKNASRGAR